jgi:hypothetical protein
LETPPHPNPLPASGERELTNTQIRNIWQTIAAL